MYKWQRSLCLSGLCCGAYVVYDYVQVTRTSFEGAGHRNITIIIIMEIAHTLCVLLFSTRVSLRRKTMGPQATRSSSAHTHQYWFQNLMEVYHGPIVSGQDPALPGTLKVNQPSCEQPQMFRGCEEHSFRVLHKNRTSPFPGLLMCSLRYKFHFLRKENCFLKHTYKFIG